VHPLKKSCGGSRVYLMRNREEYFQGLLDKLRTLKVEGPGRGGPYVGIVHNPVTREIVAEGNDIVPFLIERLKTGDLTETIFAVFSLRELRTKSAKGAVEQLQRSDRFRDVNKDLTLDMQIKYYLRDVDSW
jgi:hypothetical protein